MTSFSLHHGQFHWQQQLQNLVHFISDTCSKKYLSQTSMWHQSSHWRPPYLSKKQKKKKPSKFSQLDHYSWSLSWMIPSHKEPQWLFWMSDDFKISNCFYPPVANIWDILMFNLFVCCSTFNTQSTWKSFSNNRDMPIIDNSRLCVNTTSRQGIKQLGNSFWLCFFFHFPMKVGRGHIHSSRGKSLAPNC